MNTKEGRKEGGGGRGRSGSVSQVQSNEERAVDAVSVTRNVQLHVDCVHTRVSAQSVLSRQCCPRTSDFESRAAMMLPTRVSQMSCQDGDAQDLPLHAASTQRPEAQAESSLVHCWLFLVRQISGPEL